MNTHPTRPAAMATPRRRAGRKSAAALATVMTLPAPRLPVPVELTSEEGEIFIGVVNAQPADWTSPAAMPLLVQYCRHTIQARRLAELIERAAGNRETDFYYYADLLRQQRSESAIIVTLGTKLRLSPQSLRNQRGYLHHERPGSVPWET